MAWQARISRHCCMRGMGEAQQIMSAMAVQAFPWNTQLPPWERAQQHSQASPGGEDTAWCSACAQPLSAEDSCCEGQHATCLITFAFALMPDKPSGRM